MCLLIMIDATEACTIKHIHVNDSRKAYGLQLLN